MTFCKKNMVIQKCGFLKIAFKRNGKVKYRRLINPTNCSSRKNSYNTMDTLITYSPSGCAATNTISLNIP
jgi:hypothetical protein